MMYQLLASNLPGPPPVLRLSDGAVIPPDRINPDYIAYQQWLAAGNTPLPVAAKPPLPPDDARRAEMPDPYALFQMLVADIGKNGKIDSSGSFYALIKGINDKHPK